LGGYTERRVAVNTDTIGTPPVIPPARNLVAPARGVQQGDYYRRLLSTYGFLNDRLYQPQLAVYLQDSVTGKRYPASSNAATDLGGQVVIPGVSPGTNYLLNCSADGGATFSDCSGTNATYPTNMLAAATTDYVCDGCVNTPSAYGGGLVLQDGSVCGTSNEFFNVHSTATATLLDASNKVISGPVQVSSFGEYAFPTNATNGVSVKLQCEGAKALIISANFYGNGQSVLTGIKAPVVSTMSAVFNTQQVGLFLPPPTGLPSDILARADGYLAEKGVDSRLGACKYYAAVGAVTGCDSAGKLQNPVSFEDWKRTVKIDKYATGTQYNATYINKADLNLTRQHASISYSATQTGAYVCNHLGPAFALVSPQADIDAAISNTVNGKNLVACVAMDYSVSPNVNGNKPFIRFLIFGPSGQLLPSVNLDGRREKFVPGTCVVCHGGDHYAGKYPQDGSGFADVGGHFLPYDTGNFEFSSTAGLREADQEQQIYFLNQNVLKTAPTPAAQQLIAGWYGSGQVLNKNYVPASWQAQGSTAQTFYKEVIARSCRSCHVAMLEPYNFDHYANAAPFAANSRLSDAGFDIGANVCGGSAQFARDHMMPNSLVTFNRLWLSYQNTVGLADQVALLNQFYGGDLPVSPCVPGITP